MKTKKNNNGQESSDENSKESCEGARKPEQKIQQNEKDTKKKKQDKSDGLAFNYIESGFGVDGKSKKLVRAQSSHSSDSKLLSSSSYESALETHYFDA